MSRKSDKPESTRLAWAGFRLRTPSGWRPLDIQGDWRKGKLVLGDAAAAIALIRWARPGLKKFRAAERRLGKAPPRSRKTSGQLTSAEPVPNGPTTADFPEVVCSRGAGTEGSAPDLWCGYSPRADLALEVAVNSRAPEKTRRKIFSRVLPTLSASGPDEPVRWEIFSAVFRSPPGFAMAGKRTVLGDLALLFRSGCGRRLLLRQIYPAGVALERRTMERWLETSPFKERRRCLPEGEPADWSVELTGERSGRTLAGRKRLGRKCVPFPFRWLAPKWSASAAVHDEERERLLLAEYDWPKGPPPRGPEGEEVLSSAIAGMVPDAASA